MASLGRGKAGGLQDMIKSATAENRPGPDWMLNKAIVDYINRSPNRGSDKAFKYLKARFTQSHVKVQNLSLLVLETCMKNCGHMFREKLPFSDLWEELHKVAILKRKADAQIYNKVLALIEDWADAINLPAYRQEYNSLKSGAARFPARNDRDLSGYIADGAMGGIPTQLVIPPGTSDEDRRAIEAAQAELNGSAAGSMPPYSPSGGKPPAFPSPYGPPPGGAPPPYTYGGNGHFAPPPPPPVAANAAQLPANHLAAGQPPAKLKEDLFSTANSIELFKEMLAPISADDAADVKQEYVREQAEQCGEMLRRLGALAEAETDEATLQQTLELHSALEQAMGQYEALLAVAEGRAPPEAAIQQEPPSVSAPPPTAGAPARVAPKPSLNLLDFDDTATMSPPPLAEPEPSAPPIGVVPPPNAVTLATEPMQGQQPAGPAAAALAPAPAAPPKPRSLADDILGDLYSLQPPALTAGGGGSSTDWGAAAVRSAAPATNNPFASPDVPETAPVDGFGESAFGAAAAPGGASGDGGFGESAFGEQPAFGGENGVSSPQPKLPVAAPSPVNLSPQSNYPPPQRPAAAPSGSGPPDGGGGGGFQPFGQPGGRQPGGSMQPHGQPGGMQLPQQRPGPQQQQQYQQPPFGQQQFGQPPPYGMQHQHQQQPQYGQQQPPQFQQYGQMQPFGQPQFGGPPQYGQQNQGFGGYPMPLALPPPSGYAPPQQGYPQDFFAGGGGGGGGPQQGGPSYGAPPGGDPWGAPPAFGAPSPQGGGGGGGGNPWGAPAPGGAPSPGGSSVGAKPAPSWPATKESDPFGDLVTLRK